MSKTSKIWAFKVDYFDFSHKKFELLVWIRCEGNCRQLLRLWNFFVFFWFFPLKLVYFWTKSRKKRCGCFFHSICATDLKFGTKNIGRTKLSNLKTLIFENFWCPEVSRSNSYQKNIGAKLTHWHMPSLCELD